MDRIYTSGLLERTAQIISAYVATAKVRSEDIGTLIFDVHLALHKALSKKAEPNSAAPKPASQIKNSITPDYLISLEDGKRYRSLKRHLRSAYGMNPDQYRAKWGLPSDYPMVAPNYARLRSEVAKKMGLGRKASSPAEPVTVEVVAAKRVAKRHGRAGVEIPA